MIVINRTACSEAFAGALDAIESGRDVRRARWPAGMVLRKQDGRVAVIRDGSTISPGWMGPSGTEMEASDWRVVGADR